MKRWVAMLLAAGLLLAGCSVSGKAHTVESDREALIRILNDVSANMHPAAAGSSLTAARLAADLISWAATTKMEKKEAAQVVAEWLKEQSPEIRQAFREKVENVSETYGRILKDGAADLLESAGIEKDMSNLGSRMKEIVEAILASGGLD